MPILERFSRAIAYLREEIRAEDISANPVVEHPHNTFSSKSDNHHARPNAKDGLFVMICIVNQCRLSMS
jgi:hypothetical protein